MGWAGLTSVIRRLLGLSDGQGFERGRLSLLGLAGGCSVTLCSAMFSLPPVS